ncbi:MAG: hypothetical protein ACJA09_003804 [Alcanivorax sp.]|jgi:hypothetical protein
MGLKPSLAMSELVQEKNQRLSYKPLLKHTNLQAIRRPDNERTY